MKIRLVKNWPKLRHAISVQMMALAGSTLATWLLMPEEWKAALPHWVAPTVALSFLVCGAVGRFIQQDKVSGE